MKDYLHFTDVEVVLYNESDVAYFVFLNFLLLYLKPKKLIVLSTGYPKTKPVIILCS